MGKLDILVIRKDIFSNVVDLGNVAKARATVVQNGGPIPIKHSPDVTNMR